MSFSHSWQPSNSSFFSVCSDSSCEFSCLRQQTWLQQITILCYLTSNSKQISTHLKPISKCHYKHFKISKHHTITYKTTLTSNQTKYRLQSLSFHIQNTTDQQATYLHNGLSFPTNSVSTRSSDSLVLSILFVRSSLGKIAFSVIGSRLWNSLSPDTRNTSSLPIFRSKLKTHLFKIAFPPYSSFPSPLTVYLNFDSWYSYILCPIDWHLVRLPAMPTSIKSTTFLIGLENYGINPWTIVLDLISARFVGGWN